VRIRGLPIPDLYALLDEKSLLAIMASMVPSSEFQQKNRKYLPYSRASRNKNISARGSLAPYQGVASKRKGKRSGLKDEFFFFGQRRRTNRSLFRFFSILFALASWLHAPPAQSHGIPLR
jgi:hypothetical protein